MKIRTLMNVILLLALLMSYGVHIPVLAQPQADEQIAVIRPDCGGYPGPEPCYTSLAAWEADYGGIDFGSNAPGDLVAIDSIAVARIEGTWTQADTTALTLNGWTTDVDHYIHIYTSSEARHNGISGSGYRLMTTADRPVTSEQAHVRIEGLEIHSLSASSPVYVRPGPGIDGEIHISHNLIHGNGTDTASGVYLYDYDGIAKIWNNIIYDVGGLGYQAGIQTSRGLTYAYNNTIVDIVAGFAIRSGSAVIAKNNLTEAPADDFYGSFSPGSDFNASDDDSAIGYHSRRNQTFTFVNRAGDDFHLAANDAGARNYGLDLSSDVQIAVMDDIDGLPRTGGWDIGADEAAAGSDTVPPVRFDGAPSGDLPATTTQVTLALQTAEAATCRYAASAEVPYGSMTDTFEVTGGITHTQLMTGLQDEQTYAYYVKCQDTDGNPNSDDFLISFYIESGDTVPPVISNVQVVNVTPYSAEVTWQTDEPCTSQIEYGLTSAYGTTSPISTTRVVNHALSLVGLDPETTYHVRVRSQDVAYNETVSADYAFTTAALSNFHYVDQNHPQASDANPGTIDQPWLTIQHAADVALPGDTIIVYPGTYGRVSIHEGGAPGAYITFKGLNLPDQSLVDPNVLFDPTNPVPVSGNPTLNAVMRGFTLQPAYPSTVPVSYVRIENFEITDIHEEGVVGQGGIYLNNTAHIQIVDNFLHDLNPDPSSYGYIGIRGSSQDNLAIVVKDNTFYRVQGTGISLVGRNWLVEGNTLSHGLDTNTDTGIEVGGDVDAMRFFGSGHVIRNNSMSDYLDEEQTGDPHIDCFQTFSVYPESQYAHDILVEGNTCDNFGQMLMVEDQSEINGTGNAVHHLTFRNNVLRGARAISINGSCDHFTFVNNVVAGGNYGAIGLTDSPNLMLANNIFYENGSGSQFIDEASKVGSFWDYNIHYPDFSWPPKQLEFDQHSLFGVDPRFVNASVGDYRLRIDSPAVDRGISQRAFNYDKVFTFRPQISAWDIGAFEAVPELVLSAQPGNQVISLNWETNITLPVTSTWTITYIGPTGDEVSPIEGILGGTRAYTLTGLTNYEWYTVTLSTNPPMLTDMVSVMPTDMLIFLPVVTR